MESRQFPESARLPSTRIPVELEDLAVPIGDLRPYEHNPRRGDVSAIAASLEANGQYRPVVVNRRTGEVLAGNHTPQAALKLGWSHLAATYVDVSDDDAARIVLVDNRSNDLAGYDDEALAELLASLPDPTFGTGYDDDALAALLDVEGESPPALTEVDEPGPVPRVPTSVLGDVWDLGSSFLVVGDATDPAPLLAALGDERPDAVWTDPPYGVNYVGGTSEALSIMNDDPEGLPALIGGAAQTIIAVCRPGAPVYVAHADTFRLVVEVALAKAGIRVRQNLVWVKPSLVLGHSDYHWRHEPILEAEVPEEGAPEPYGHEPVLYGFAPGGVGRLGRGGPHWFGDNRQTTVFEFPKPKRNAEHPTMKPVDLIVAMLKNSLPKGGLVLDLFGGSGSTLIAAHHLRSRAVLVELDRRYADAICARWQAHTGIMPRRRSDGASVDFLGVNRGA